MPHDLGKTYVIVNLAEFTLRVFHDGQQVWMTRIVDGKPTMPTPIMSADMKYITVNPTWNVPPSIVAKSICRRSRRIPTVLARIGLVVGTESDGSIHISSRPVRKTRSAGYASISPTNSWSISTTRRTSTFSPWTGGRSVTAACACRIR